MAIDFDGSDDFVDIGDSFFSDTLSVSAYIYVDAFGTKSIVCKRNTNGSEPPGSGTNEWWFRVTTGNVVLFEVFNGGASAGSVASVTALNTGQWYHVGATCASGSTGTITLYVNGLADGSGSKSNTISNTTDRIQIGARTANNDTRYFDGKIEEVAIWNTELTAAQMLQLASRVRYTPLTVAKANLQNYYPMDDGNDGTSASTDTVLDYSGNGRNGTGRDGAGNTGLTWVATQFLSYPSGPRFVEFTPGGTDVTVPVNPVTISTQLPHVLFPYVVSASVLAPTIITSGNITVTPNALTVVSSVNAPTITAVRNVTVTPSTLTVASSVDAPTIIRFPTTGILDDFNRANQGPPPSASWDGDFKVLLNRATGNNIGDNLSHWTASTFGTDIEIYATIFTPGYIELGGRFDSNSGNGYILAWDVTDVVLYRYDGFVATQLDTATVSSLASGNRFGISCIGNRISGYVDTGSGFTEVVTAIDSTYNTTNQLYLFTDANTLVIDDFGGGTHSAGVNVTVTPSALTITSSVLAPTVTAVQNVTVTPGTLTITSSVLAPTISTGTTVTPNNLTISSSVLAPSISTGRTITPNPVTVVSSVNAPSVSYGTTITPAALTAVLSLLAPTIQAGGNVTVTPNPQTITASLLSPSIIAVFNNVVSVAAQTIASSVLNPTVSYGCTVTPNNVTLASSILAPNVSVQFSVTVQVNTLTAVLSVQTPTISGAGVSVTIPVNALSLLTGLLAPTIAALGTVPRIYRIKFEEHITQHSRLEEYITSGSKFEEYITQATKFNENVDIKNRLDENTTQKIKITNGTN